MNRAPFELTIDPPNYCAAWRFAGDDHQHVCTIETDPAKDHDGPHRCDECGTENHREPLEAPAVVEEEPLEAPVATPFTYAPGVEEALASTTRVEVGDGAGAGDLDT